MANRYLVATGNWNAVNTAIWSSTDGGAPGASVPTSSDDVFFTLLSGAITVTVVTSDANCLGFDCTGAIGTLAGSTTALNVYGSFTLSATMTWSFTAAINFLSTATGRTLTFAGKTTNSVSTFDGAGGGWILNDDWNNTLKDILPMAGITSFNTNGNTVTCGTFMSNSGISIVLGASTILCTRWSCGTGTTLSALSSTISVTGTSAFSSGGKAYGTVNISTTASVSITTTGCSFVNLSLKNSSGYVNFTLPTSISISSVFELMGVNNSSQRISAGFQASTNRSTVTCNGTVSLTNVDLVSIATAGSASWAGTSVGNGGNNTGSITYTAPVSRYWVQNSSSQDFLSGNRWASTSGGAVGSSFPLPQDSAFFDANSFPSTSYTVTCSQSGTRMPNIDFTGATNSPSFSPTAPIYSGNLTLISAMTYSPTGTVTFFGSSATVASAGKAHAGVSFNYTPGETLTILDGFIANTSISWISGGFNANNFNVTAFALTSTGSGVRTLTMGSGTFELTGFNWNFLGAPSGNVTILPGSSTIKLTSNSALSKSFYGIGKTWNNFWNATLGAGVCIIQDSSTFNDFKIDAGRTQQFVAATNTTFKSLTAVGSLGNLITLQSSTSATHTLTHTPENLATRFVSSDYLNLSYSIASPANSFYAGANSTNSGNNTGWIFTATPAPEVKAIDGVPLSQIKNINGIPAGVTKSFDGFF